jgi:hypothetical protein
MEISDLGFRISVLVPNRDDAEREWRPNQNSAILLPKSPKSSSRTQSPDTDQGSRVIDFPKGRLVGLGPQLRLAPGIRLKHAISGHCLENL